MMKASNKKKYLNVCPSLPTPPPLLTSGSSNLPSSLHSLSLMLISNLVHLVLAAFMV